MVAALFCVPYRILYPLKALDPSIDLTTTSTLAIAAYGGLGDAIMMLPALRLLKDTLTQTKVIIYVEEQTAFDIFEMAAIGDQLLLMDMARHGDSLKRWLFIWRYIRPLKPKIAVRTYLHTRWQDSVETYLSGARTRIGYVESKWLSIDTNIVETKQYQHRVQDHGDLLRQLGVKGRLDWPRIAIKDEAIRWATEILKDSCEEKIIVGIHPGCKAKDAVRRWPEEKFSAIINKLTGHKNCEIIIFGGVDDAKAVNVILQQVSPKPKVAVAQSLSRTAALIKCCDVFLSNDSGLMHLAALLRIPVIGLFGPSSFTKHGPWGGEHVGISSRRPCAPCWNDIDRGCGNADCMSAISVAEVYKHLLKIIQKKNVLKRQKLELAIS